MPTGTMTALAQSGYRRMPTTEPLQLPVVSTHNRKNLREALRGILENGYSMRASATPMQIFESANPAIGVTVLVPLYQKMKADPFPVDLDELWQELGVGTENDAIVYDDDAPLAHIRKALPRS